MPDDLPADFETPPLFTGFCGCASGAVMAALALADAPNGAAVSAVEPDGMEWTMISSGQHNGMREVALMGRSMAERQPQEDAA